MNKFLFVFSPKFLMCNTYNKMEIMYFSTDYKILEETTNGSNDKTNNIIFPSYNMTDYYRKGPYSNDRAICHNYPKFKTINLNKLVNTERENRPSYL